MVSPDVPRAPSKLTARPPSRFSLRHLSRAATPPETMSAGRAQAGASASHVSAHSRTPRMSRARVASDSYAESMAIKRMLGARAGSLASLRNRPPSPALTDECGPRWLREPDRGVRSNPSTTSGLTRRARGPGCSVPRSRVGTRGSPGLPRVPTLLRGTEHPGPRARRVSPDVVEGLLRTPRSGSRSHRGPHSSVRAGEGGRLRKLARLPARAPSMRLIAMLSAYESEATLARDMRGVRECAETCEADAPACALPADIVSGGVAARDRCRRLKRDGGRAVSLEGARGTSGLTMLDAALRWLHSYVATTRNPKGQRLAKSRVDSYLTFALGRFPLRALDGDDVRAYRLY